MKRGTVLLLALVAATVIGEGGASNARAGLIPLPTTLDQLQTTGNFAVVAPFTFSEFTFSSSAIPPSTPVISPSAVNVLRFDLGNEHGITLGGAFFAAAGTIVDYAFSYLVTAAPGVGIIDAYLSGVFSTFGGTGSVSIGETLYNADTGELIGTLEIASPPGSVSNVLNFNGVRAIRVQKDLILVGGSNGASVSFINQGYSYVPEPGSIVMGSVAGVVGLAEALRRRRRA